MSTKELIERARQVTAEIRKFTLVADPLPTVRVANPSKATEALRKGESVAVISPIDRRSRVGKHQFLVGEVDGGAHVFAVVTTEKALRFECVDDIPEDVCATIDPATLAAHGDATPVHVVPLTMVAGFATPVAINAPFGDSVFGPAIDMARAAMPEPTTPVAKQETPLPVAAHQDAVAFYKSLGVNSQEVRLIKRDVLEERFVLGVVLEPETIDSQGHVYNAEEVRKAAHNFLEIHARMGLMHKQDVTGKIKILESFLAPADMFIDGVTVKKGTWLLGARILDNELWDGVKNGKFNGWSIGGTAIESVEEFDQMLASLTI